MKYLANLLVVLGVCTATLGASGLHKPYQGPVEGREEPIVVTAEPTSEEGAWPLLGLGLVLLATGGGILKFTAGGPAGDEERRSALGTHHQRLLAVLEVVRELDLRCQPGGDIRGFSQVFDNLMPEEVAGAGRDGDDRTALASAVLDALLRERFVALTDGSDELLALVGFDRFASVWDGVATGERLLARSWSMLTDGHEEEGLAELPLALAALQRGEQNLAALVGGSEPV